MLLCHVPHARVDSDTGLIISGTKLGVLAVMVFKNIACCIDIHLRNVT